MNLLDKINNELKIALKNKNQIKTDTLRQIKTAVKNKEIFTGKKLNDEEIIGVISSLVKSHKESIEGFKKANREDLLKKEEEELKILKEFLPEEISEEELRKIINETIEEVKASGIKDMGKVMKTIMPKVKGRADGSFINKLVKEILQEK